MSTDHVQSDEQIEESSEIRAICDPDDNALRLRAPFPFFGGKSRVAHVIWERFGNVANYVEPFAGSLAVLLARPHEPRIETVNDRDVMIANFWRALQDDPEGVAHFASLPVNEADLHARHLWLVTTGAERIERLMTDPYYYNVQVAGWWAWGASAWIGGGWCGPHGRTKNGGTKQTLPHLTGSRGVQRRLPHLSGTQGVTAKRPSLGKGGRGVHNTSSDLIERFNLLADRLRYVRVCCGDWTRVLGPAVTTQNGITAVLLDPPYHVETGRDMNVYAADDGKISAAVREWALLNGNDPNFRIALCGYEGEHDMPDNWSVYAWESTGGYSNRGKKKTNGKANRKRERIWFSPGCLKVDYPLFNLAGERNK